jgi:hypothetical protein
VIRTFRWRIAHLAARAVIAVSDLAKAVARDVTRPCGRSESRSSPGRRCRLQADARTSSGNAPVRGSVRFVSAPAGRDHRPLQEQCCLFTPSHGCGGVSAPRRARQNWSALLSGRIGPCRHARRGGRHPGTERLMRDVGRLGTTLPTCGASAWEGFGWPPSKRWRAERRWSHQDIPAIAEVVDHAACSQLAMPRAIADATERPRDPALASCFGRRGSNERAVTVGPRQRPGQPPA